MTNLPDVIHPPLETPVRTLAHALRMVKRAAWRLSHPRSREPFVEAPRPTSLIRVHYDASDGWRSPIFHLPACPGGAGEPVVLAHTLAMGPDVFRYGNTATLARVLQKAGFSVYLPTHRGDVESRGPRRRRSSGDGCDFDGIVQRDVPAMLEQIAKHSGFPSVHWVGHGLGGQAGLAWCGWSGAERIASLVTVGAAVRFSKARSPAVRLARASALFPRNWSVPTQAATRAIAPWVADGGVSPSARVRGAMRFASEDVAAGLLAQVCTWLQEGSLVDASGCYDYTVGFRRAAVPFLCVTGAGDAVAPVDSVRPAVRLWGDSDVTLAMLPDHYGHLDVLLGKDAEAEVFRPLCRWLEERRRLAWGDVASETTKEIRVLGDFP